MRPKALILGVSAAALVASLSGGAVAYSAASRSVTLSVDGKERELSTFDRTVGDLLRREGLDVASRDSVTPSPDTKLSDGSRVVLRHARPLTLTLDQERREVWVTALDVGEALTQLGVRDDGAFVSASRSKSIPLSGLTLTVNTVRDVTIQVNDRRRTVRTAAATVGDALLDAGVDADRNDRVSQALSAFPRDGQVVKVTRVEFDTRTREVKVDYQTVQKYTGSLSEGNSKVTASGDRGLKVQRVKVTLVGGKAVERKVVDSHWKDRPNDRVVLVGTRDRVRASRSSSSSSIPSSGGLNWAALAECESGGDPQAYNPAGPYYGLYQFSLSTWQSVGGSGLPSDASPAEQTNRAQILYNQAGADQWPVCGSRLFS